MPPTLTIIVPVYNSACYISACLDSILRQSYNDFELLLINDGSTDNSEEICLKYVAQDTRVKYFSQANAGPSQARNTGLAHACGKYITFVDSDDEIADDTFQNINFLENDAELSLVQYPVIVKQTGKEDYQMIPIRSEYLKGCGNICTEWCVGSEEKILIAVWNKIFRKTLFDGVMFPNEITHGEDGYLLCQILPRCQKIYFSEIGIYYYYRREGSITMEAEGTFAKKAAALYVLMWKTQIVMSMPELTLYKDKITYYYFCKLIWTQYSALHEKMTDFYEFGSSLKLTWKGIFSEPVSIRVRVRMCLMKILGIRLFTIYCCLRRKLANNSEMA